MKTLDPWAPKNDSQRKSLTSGEIAKLIGGTLVGDDQIQITGVKPLETAGEQDLSFFSPTSKRLATKMLEVARKSHAGAMLVRELDSEISATQIVVSNPSSAVIEVSTLFHVTPLPSVGAHPTAIVSHDVSVSPSARIGAYCIVGEAAVIGEDVVMHPHSVVYPGAVIGSRTVLHSFSVVREFVRLGSDCLIQNGVVVGGDGFGYIPSPDGRHRRIPHLGTVVLGDRVDIGANATIDRATLGETCIGSDTKIDNLVMAGHNVKIGCGTFICAQTGLSGSSEVGHGSVLGGQVGVADHAMIGNQIRLAAKSGVTSDISEPGDYGGFPAKPVRQWHKQVAVISRLAKKSGNSK